MTAAAERRREGVHFTFEDDLVTAIDIDSGVAGCGSTKADALADLADALRLYTRDADRFESDADERAALRELGIDPDEVEPTDELPEFLE